jgi:hypothetical protein
MPQDLKALQVPQSTGKADSSQIDLTAAFNFTGTLQKSGTNLATTSDVTTGAQSEANLRTASGSLSASLSVNSQKITNLLTPSDATDAATKAYVDSVAAGLDVKPSVAAASTANLTLSGEQTIDGVSVVAGNRVLVKDQSTASQNGIYVAAAGSWARAADMAAASNAAGAFTFVEAGTVAAGRGYVVSSGAVVGTDALVWTQFSGGASYTAGDGIAISGGSIAVDLATDPGLEISGGKLRAKVDSSGVITRAAGGLNVQAASASQNGYQNATQFGLTSSLGAMGSRATLTTTDATPETISLPALSTSSLRRVAVWVAVKNTSDLAKSLYREITFIARRGSSGNSVLVGSVVSGELADNNGSADPSGMGAISLAYTVGSGGSDSLTFTGIAATNLSTDYGLLISTI